MWYIPMRRPPSSGIPIGAPPSRLELGRSTSSVLRGTWNEVTLQLYSYTSKALGMSAEGIQLRSAPNFEPDDALRRASIRTSTSRSRLLRAHSGGNCGDVTSYQVMVTHYDSSAPELVPYMKRLQTLVCKDARIEHATRQAT